MPPARFTSLQDYWRLRLHPARRRRNDIASRDHQETSMNKVVTGSLWASTLVLAGTLAGCGSGSSSGGTHHAGGFRPQRGARRAEDHRAVHLRRRCHRSFGRPPGDGCDAATHRGDDLECDAPRWWALVSSGGPTSQPALIALTMAPCIPGATSWVNRTSIPVNPAAASPARYSSTDNAPAMQLT